MTDSQRILDSIRRLVRLLRLADRAAQSAVGLSGAQLFVLQELGKTPALSLGALAERTRTDQSSVSVVVTRLVEAGLVSRDRDDRDARRLVLTLTRSGRALLHKAPAAMQQKIIGALEEFKKDELTRFADSFARLVDLLGAESGAAPMMFEDDATEAEDHDRPHRRREGGAAK
jgi:DNA-binding MarR family transcriptional regulator